MISLLVPTRGRPQNIVRFAESVANTATGLVEVIWCVDQDDVLSRMAVEDLPTDSYLPSHRLLVGPRQIPCILWNQAAMIARGDIVGLMGDDIVMRTPGWDVLVSHAFDHIPDRIALVYGRDGFRDEVHASHPFLSREWVEAVGYATPENFSQDMNDVWLNEVAEMIGRRVFLPDVFTQHLHPDDPSLGVELDQTYLDNMTRRDTDDTHALYGTLQAARDRDAEKLQQVMA